MDEDDEIKFERDFSILRTNRQIHSEASSLFYKEVIFKLEPGYIFPLVRKRRGMNLGRPNLTWKYNPLKGTGKTDEFGATIYDTPRLYGDLEPHIVAKIERICFDAYFDDRGTGNLEMGNDDDEEYKRRFNTLIQSSTIFAHLAKILSNSPRITQLDIIIEVNMNLADEEDMDYWDDSSEMDAVVNEREPNIDSIGNTVSWQATELLFELKVMDPLLKLSNVANCAIKFGVVEELKGEPDTYKHLTKYLKLLHEMKETIESNFKGTMDGS